MPEDEKGREIPGLFFAENGSMDFIKAAPFTEEDKAEADAMRKSMTCADYDDKKKTVKKNKT